MVLNRVTTGLFTAIVLVSAVHNLKVIARESKPRAMLTQIVRNISRVNNLLEKFIKHFEQVEGVAEESDQSAEAVSDVKDIFDVYQIAKSKDKLRTPQKNEKIERRKLGNNMNHNEIDNNFITFKFKTSEKNKGVREFPMASIHRENSADEIVGGQRRVNKNLNDEKEYLSNDLPKNNTNKIHTSKVNIPTTSDEAPQTTNKPERAVEDSNSEEDKLIQDEISNAKTLRQAYDEACKKVLKRKCNKALQAVLKDVCNPRKRKCTGKFKEDFKNNGDTGCDKQFDKKASICRMGYDDPEPGGNADISESVTNDNNTNLLRSKTEQYEKACKKANYKKGLAACKYGVDETCDENECLESKQKAFNKSCQKRCKEKFGIEDSDSSDDDDSDDKDSVGWDSA